jgi:hypothetical protein
VKLVERQSWRCLHFLPVTILCTFS